MRFPNCRGGTRSPFAPRIATLLILILGGLLLSGCQDLFVYHPTVEDEATLRALADSRRLKPWQGAGQERIGWYAASPTPGEAQRVILFHGNGGQAVDRDHYVRAFHGPRTRGEWDVYILEYPGYGSRPGEPSEEALLAAARDATERLLDQEPDKPLYVVGTSLGSGVASQIAAEYSERIPAVFLITPFTNIEDVGGSTFPRFLVRMILRDRYDNEGALAQYNGRVAVLLAGEDRVVPTELGRRLYDGYDGPKELWIQPEAGHNTLDFDPRLEFWAEVTRFLTE